ncbi:DNA replication/repair protein RecF [Antarcticirhabdus aurantiaca]|uniref:DNA replication/repair protein RecF n=1 Tax=Antarcticirhabdus aurantiaca TaxID=2606717 RepID=A0ACD4NYE0_9HYPH|nr:DNA replication/repair protein RecF [Antarcticirhabdus aurantiaca]WAJ31384.1 DNA replication/repair protein RecF [Jeongeuplla avenae]
MSAPLVSSLRLVDFRNYASLGTRFEKPFVVFSGENGAGKTNLLEALSLLTPGRGLRRAAYREVARVGGTGGFAVRTTLTGEGGETEVATFARPGEDGSLSRVVRIDDTEDGGADALLDVLRVVWLTPAMDGLFTGPAGDRRRFLDRMVLSVDPAHGRRSLDYEKAMRGRNRLLGEARLDEVWLSGLEAQMAELGVAIHRARAELVSRLGAEATRAGADAPFPTADLQLAGGYDFEDPSAALPDLVAEVRTRLAKARWRDRAAGRTLEGPHRGDLLVTHRAKAMPAEKSSTGEQKALLIGLVLAHAGLVAALSGLPPVLLLDEIAAHLDPGRRAALFDLVGGLGGQAFMTGTDAALFEALGERADHFDVSDGRLACRTSP